MPWNPDIYNQFKNIRYQPFFDLAAMITPDGLHKAVDIGCGTGEQTSILTQQFELANFLGIDPSPDMLAKSAAFTRPRLQFAQSTVEDFIATATPGQWDLIFSNAALQWLDDHAILFPSLITLLSGTGQLAIQMPVQKENLLNTLLLDLVQQPPFVDFLQGWKRESPLLSIDEYAQLLFENGLHHIQLTQKVYPIIATSPQELFDFISGSSLIPYLERMQAEEQALFTTAYKRRIQAAFRRFPAMYAFKRLLLYGRK